ncbi:MAG: hypothetical protein IJ851_01585 [Eubacterium sp.]|nr:hypothetical protein [Eubacterium sp.]
MQITKKKYFGIVFGAAVLFAMLVLFICLPQTTFGAQVGLGDEEPYLYCTYTDQNGDIVDGNALTAGETYDVSFVVENLSQAAVIQVTATYSEDMRVAAAPSSLLSDTVANMSSMGYVLEGGNIVFGFVSDETDYSVFDDKIVLATVQMTFDQGGDAEDYLSFSADPNLTFICVDHSDPSYADEYAINAGAGYDYDGTLYMMTADVSPSFGHTVSGSLVIATGANDANNGNAVYGEYTVSVYSDSEETELVTSVTSIYDNTGESPVNSFTLNNLTAGTYYAVISSQYSIARHVTIQVSDSDIVAGDIAMICCDYNSDGLVSVPDAKFVYAAAGTGDNAEYCDLNGDGMVSVPDAKVVYGFAASASYPQLVIS